MNFAELFETFQQNMMPEFWGVLVEDLGVTVKSLQILGVGFYPGKQVWVFAERNADGEIIGLTYRTRDGKKFMAEGSKRGLTYVYNENYGEKRYEAGRCHWVQIYRTGRDCPICGRSDWCRVSSDYEDSRGPSAVACNRISEGSTGRVPPDAHLYILDAERQHGANGSVLSESKLPFVIVEGSSDVLAAMDLGYVAIGRPSAKGGMDLLKEMPLARAEIWIIGENDAGVGKEGMEKTFINLKKLSKNIRYVLPPKGIKDLRQWAKSGLTQQVLTEYMERKGRSRPSDMLSSNVPEDIADQFMKDYYTDENGTQLLRLYYDQWIAWSEGIYAKVEKNMLRGRLYEFLRGKRVEAQTKEGKKIVRYAANRNKVSDIIDALNRQCPYYQDPPTWISEQGIQDVSKLIAFKNGILDVDRFCEGDTNLLPLTPDLFTFATFPYDYDPAAWSQMWMDYLAEAFNEDEDSIRLLAQWYGYCCVPDPSMEKLMIFLGPRRAGKGIVIDAMTAMLGKSQCMATSYQQMAEKFGMKPLVGKLAAILGESKQPKERTVNQALEILLRIVGGDLVPVRPMRQEAYDTKLVCRFTIGCNELPMFTDHSQALMGRTNILKFPNSYAGQEDYGLKRRITDEARQGRLINFALWGLKDLHLSGRFIVPGASSEEFAQFRDLTAPMQSFLDECCIISSTSTEPRDRMWTAWRGWCDENGRNPGPKPQFKCWVRQFEPTVELTKEVVDGNREYTFVGIRLQPWTLSHFLGAPE
ncbi:hypothetical protein LCGC14_0356190 [marine sediment metagenome]|uniref:SF3 helicase domain-containing protein n=1 Tax=marine sediment metagenome TaxID=412755 RepID=A0A0F9TSF2_9ZZZZ